jgi:hypothetical protein
MSNTYIATVYDEPYLKQTEEGKYVQSTRSTEVLFTYEPGDESAAIVRTSSFPIDIDLKRDKDDRNLAAVIRDTVLFGMSETEMFVALELGLQCKEIKGTFKFERINLDNPEMAYIIGCRRIPNSITYTVTNTEDLTLA